jgi:Flp pilus assembly protein TadB
MPNPNRALGLGFLALAILIVLYYIWPYLVAFLAVVGAAQLYRVWRDHFRRGN